MSPFRSVVVKPGFFDTRRYDMKEGLGSDDILNRDAPNR